MGVCLTPLCIDCEEEGIANVVWQNPRPSSTRFCKSGVFKFVKDSSEVIKQILDDIVKISRTLKTLLFL